MPGRAAMATRAAVQEEHRVCCCVQEASLMASLRHPNICFFMAFCAVPPCVITEYCAMGSLADVLWQARRSPAQAGALEWRRRLLMVGGFGY